MSFVVTCALSLGLLAALVGCETATGRLGPPVGTSIARRAGLPVPVSGRGR